MSTVSDIIARLAGAGTPFALVEGAAELAAVTDRPEASPAAFVFVAREASADNETFTGPVEQRCERDIAVAVFTENLSDDTGAAAAADIETLKAFVRGRLLGWTPPEENEPMTHVSGEIVQAAGGAVWFEDVFSSPTYLREVQP